MSEDDKLCVACAEKIAAAALLCRHCNTRQDDPSFPARTEGAFLEESPQSPDGAQQRSDRYRPVFTSHPALTQEDKKTWWLPWTLLFGFVLVVVAVANANPANEPVPVEATESLSFDNLAAIVNNVVPGCVMERYSISNNRLYDDEPRGGNNVIYELRSVDEFTKGSGQGDYFYFDGADENGDTWFGLCHSEGKTRLSMSEGETFRSFNKADGSNWVGWDENRQIVDTTSKDCTWWDRLSRSWAQADEAFVSGCETLMADADAAGFWVGIREHTSADVALEFFQQEASNPNPFGAAPLAVVDRYTMTFAGPWPHMSGRGIQSVDGFWSSLLDSIPGSMQASDINASYPSRFEDETDDVVTRTLFARWQEVAGCSQPLVLTDFNWRAGQCGELEIRVFQADLATGSCAFLGEYNDSTGTERTGLFEYCGAFAEGAAVEGKNYTLRVKVLGETSYETRGGWEQEALSFSVLG